MRYFGEGALALWYGERAADFLKDNTQEVSLIVTVLVLLIAAGWFFFKARRAA
jgi:hypothetical protein